MRSGKSLVPLLSILAVLAMVVAGVAIVLQMQERDKRLAKEQELRLLLAENDDLKARLDETQEAKSKLEGDLEGVRRELLHRDHFYKIRGRKPPAQPRRPGSRKHVIGTSRVIARRLRTQWTQKDRSRVLNRIEPPRIVQRQMLRRECV